MNADEYCQSRLPLSSPDNMRIFDKYGNPVAWVDATAGTLGFTKYLVRAGNAYDSLQADIDHLRAELVAANAHRQHLLAVQQQLVAVIEAARDGILYDQTEGLMRELEAALAAAGAAGFQQR